MIICTVLSVSLSLFKLVTESLNPDKTTSSTLHHGIPNNIKNSVTPESCICHKLPLLLLRLTRQEITSFLTLHVWKVKLSFRGTFTS